jgi:ribosomal-protein-alanine N-acetyltransferase
MRRTGQAPRRRRPVNSALGRMRTLLAPNLLLEPLVEAHAREMFEVLSDPAIYEFENSPPPSSEWLEDRYRRLEQRGPASKSEKWLNWVIRLPNGQLAGYVQATVLQDQTSLVAYELNSQYWRQGIASAAVQTMMDELSAHYAVQTFVAVLKPANYRSTGLLRKLGFTPVSGQLAAKFRDEADEMVMVKRSPGTGNAA